MKRLLSTVVLIALHLDGAFGASCTPSITRVSAGDVPLGQLCSGQIVLNEEFNSLDTSLWEHEITLGGGGVSLQESIRPVTINLNNSSSFRYFFCCQTIEWRISMVCVGCK